VSILSSLRAVLFDLDGVLVDSRVPIARSIHYALERSGLAPHPEADLHARIGDPLHGVFVDLLRAQGADPARAVDCMALYRERYRDLSLSEARLVPGMERVLRALAEEKPIGLATSKPLEFARPILERLAVADLFATLAGPPLARTEGESKVETTRRALLALGLAPGAAALVGDRHHDGSAARSHGLAAVGVTWGAGSEAELRAAGAEWLVAAPNELARLLLGV
jgi:phosphoglycolate phosphatase